jgi:uncharacterized protein YbaP (TraB family)
VSGPALWLVERATSKVYLFGETVGVGPADAWLDDRIREALDECRELWCEVADAQQIARSPLLVEHGLSDTPLSSRLSDHERQHLHETATALGIDPTTLEGLRPWLAGQLLEHAHRSYIGIDATAGPHEVLVGIATDAGKTIRTELPDVDATLAFFSDLDAVAGIEYLMWTVDRVADDGTESRRQVAAWIAGDDRVVSEQVAALQHRYPRLFQRLLVDRNRAWIPRIDSMLDGRASAFVLVGDSHLPGEEGIPALLEQRGLDPRRLT